MIVFKTNATLNLFPKGEFLEELFEWVLLFLSRFYLFYGLEILNPYDLCLYCGGWWGVFCQKNRSFCFHPHLLYINNQDNVLISDMVFKIVYGCSIKSSEHFLLFLCGNINIQLVCLDYQLFLFVTL